MIFDEYEIAMLERKMIAFDALREGRSVTYRMNEDGSVTMVLGPPPRKGETDGSIVHAHTDASHAEEAPAGDA